ncbi:hypothetical protein SAMN05444483_12719 [Salegentibacter echinorum]|uniref:Uncharacterized protein n=1 Tax=Salegentibacter echinorum TaxID=1073325 RepID=A0A1M5ME40_SALEC|nr:hypothetical protein [Salegentibacter echinorum]SHG75432.1 hypothetical protein SAMN05444483_12719 [Salegentibacter echinorum]
MKNLRNKILFGFALLGLIAFNSCKNQEEKTPETQTTAPVSKTSNNSAKSTETPDVNPPHGQPGHRCDMPVGASLKNANTKKQPEMTTSPIRVRQNKPTKNPPHGEPFHDCSIPVGADLES